MRHDRSLNYKTVNSTTTAPSCFSFVLLVVMMIYTIHYHTVLLLQLLLLFFYCAFIRINRCQAMKKYFVSIHKQQGNISIHAALNNLSSIVINNNNCSYHFMKGSNKESKDSNKGTKYEKTRDYISPTKHCSIIIYEQNQWYVYIPYHITRTIYRGYIILKGCNEMT